MSAGSSGLQGLLRDYREEAGARYGRFVYHVLRSFPRAISLGLLRGHVATVHGAPVGLLTFSIGPDIARIGFLHTVPEVRGRGLEERLLAACLNSLASGGQIPARVVCEAMVVSHHDPDGLFAAKGFAVVPRWIMKAPVGPSRLVRPARGRQKAVRDGPGGPGWVAREWRAGDVAGCAEVLVDANSGSVDGLIYPELLDGRMATHAIQGIVAGSFGRFLRRATAVAEAPAGAGPKRGEICGVALCSRSAPEEGFIVELAVRKTWQRQGVGAALLARSLSRLSAAGVSSVVLGVTQSNEAAVRLYRKHGFEVHAEFGSYYLPDREGE